MRKYDIKEIDDLRHAVENKYLYGTYSPVRNGMISRSFMEDEKVKVVEEQVRTLMAAGLTAGDLKDTITHI